MRRPRKVSDFRIQTHASKVPEKYRHLPSYNMSWSEGVVFLPTQAYRFEAEIPNWTRQPRLVIYENYYWHVADFATGLGLPGCFGKDRDAAVLATLEVLDRVGEERFWKLQAENEEIIKIAGARLNGEVLKLKPVAIPNFIATQLSLL